MVSLREESQTVFINVRVWDGLAEEVTDPTSVLIEGNVVKAIGSNVHAGVNARAVDGGGRVLMPGLIDAHWHSVFANLSVGDLIQSDFGYVTLAAARGAGETLLRGFTTVRDVGGNCFAVKRATDEGMIPGPRMYPSGAAISQTSGHFDFRGPNDVPANPAYPLTYYERNSIVMVADGVPEVIKRVREQLRMGATQIKLAVGGGVSSPYDPLDVAQYTFEEIKAAVDVAKTWNTYVAVHAFTDRAVQIALEAGVVSIEHGNLLHDETFQMMAERGAWLSMQPILNDEDAIPFQEGSPQHEKFVQVTDGTSRGIALAKKHGVKVAFGTDCLFDAKLAKKQGKLLAKLQRWFTPYEALRMATHDNAQLIKLCGPRDPYPGDLGVVKEGALADLILVDGNPLQEIDLVGDGEKNFVIIMKDGKIHKNTLDQ